MQVLGTSGGCHWVFAVCLKASNFELFWLGSLQAGQNLAWVIDQSYDKHRPLKAKSRMPHHLHSLRACQRTPRHDSWALCRVTHPHFLKSILRSEAVRLCLPDLSLPDSGLLRSWLPLCKCVKQSAVDLSQIYLKNLEVAPMAIQQRQVLFEI